MLKRVDLTQYTFSEKLSNDDNNEFVFNLPHITYLSHSSSNDNNKIVVKQFPSISLDQFSKITHNVESINAISHPCLAKVLGFFQGNNIISPSLIYTYYPFRSVKDLIKSFKSGDQNNKYKLFNGTHFLKICFGVANAMNLMHSHHPQFIHRDLRAGTVLLNEDFEPFVSGYGLSEVNSDKKYVAPEIIGNSSKIIDPASLSFSDVYAYGVFLKKLLKTFIISCNISKNKQEPLNCFNSLIKNCKTSNPLNRPKFCEILLTLNNTLFKNALKSIQNSGFDEIKYNSYCKGLADIPSDNNFIFSTMSNNINDDDSDFDNKNDLEQINSRLNEKNNAIQIQKLNDTQPQKKTNFLSKLFGRKDESINDADDDTDAQPKNRSTQPIIQIKNGNIKYPAKVASQMIVSQPRGKPALLNQSFTDQSQQQSSSLPPPQKLPPLPPQQQNQYNSQFTKSINSYQFTNNHTILNQNDNSQSSFTKPPTNTSYNRNNHLLASRGLNEINSSHEDSKKSLIAPSLQISSRPSESFIDQNSPLSPKNSNNSTNSSGNNSSRTDRNKKLDSNEFNEFDSLNRKRNGYLSSRLINNNNNYTKQTTEQSSQNTRLLGPSLLRLSNTNIPRPTIRCTDDIYEDGLHNDKGDTVYLNIIRATKLFKEAAERGHIDSMFRLAMKFMNGAGAKPNVYDAVRYFKKSWEVGQKSESASRLAEIYLTHNSLRNINEGEKYLEEALRANDLYANYLVVKLFVENNKYNYFYCPGPKKDLESASREALISVRFCLRREYKLNSPIFVEFAKIAPKSFINSIERDVVSDPSAMYYLGILCHQAILDSPPTRAVSLLESSFAKNYKSAFDYFVSNNLKQFSSSSPQKGCYDIINGAKLAKSGREAEAISFLRKGSESCTWAPDYEAIQQIAVAMINGSVDFKPVLDLLTFYADNGSGPAKEELGIILILGIKTEKNAIKGLFYLKSAFDDPNYEMKNYQFLRDNCPGFYSDSI